MRNIFLIATDKPSRLIQKRITNELKLSSLNNPQLWNNINIYITSDEEITGFENNIWVIKGERIFFWQNTMALVSNNKPKKIILTTDQDLINDGVQAIDDKFLQWFVKNPSCESVEIDCWTIRTKDKVVYEPPLKEYEIIIPSEPKQELPKSEIDWSRFPKSTKDAVGYVEPKQETLEEAYTNKNIRNWWLDKTENERRLMISVYFKGGNSENIDTLYGIMPEEMEEIYNINIKEEPKQETTLEDAAENFYREFPSNPLDKPEWHYNRDVDCFKKRKAFINGAKWEQENSNVNALHFEIDALKRLVKVLEHQQERMYSEEDMIEFGEWMKILPLTVSGFVIKDKNIVIKKTKELLKYWFENFKKK